MQFYIIPCEKTPQRQISVPEIILESLWILALEDEEVPDQYNGIQE